MWSGWRRAFQQLAADFETRVRQQREELEQRFKALREDFDSRFRQRDLEYEKLSDEVLHWMQKTGARARREHAPPPADPDEFAHLDPVSRAIHQRRKAQGRGIPGDGNGEE